MKAAAVFPSERKFSVIDHPEPRIGANSQIKLRMLDIGICGTDKEIAAFEYGTPPDGSPYLIIGHEALGEVVETGSAVTRFRPGDLAIPSVRRPCDDPACIACRAGRQDFCYTGKFTERGIKQRHGFMSEFVVEQEQYVNPVPAALREIAVLVEPLTIAEKAVTQLFQVQQRLPWVAKGTHAHRALVLGAGPVGLLGAMKLAREGFDTTVYSRSSSGIDMGELVKGFGGRFVHAEDASVPDLAAQIGNIDVVYEAVGASALAYEVMPLLGTNGVFIFTGVPGRKAPISLDASRLMRDHVLKNQVIFGTVNASIQSFAAAIADLQTFFEWWPGSVRSLITARYPIDRAAEMLSEQARGIKNVIAF